MIFFRLLKFLIGFWSHRQGMPISQAKRGHFGAESKKPQSAARKLAMQ